MTATPDGALLRRTSLSLTTFIALVSGVTAVGAVLLHMVGVVMHVRFLGYWGIDAELFPKSADWILIWGYYGIFERAVAALHGVAAELLQFIGAAIVLGAYLAVLSTPIRQDTALWSKLPSRWPQWLRGFVERFIKSFLVLLLLPVLLFFLVFLMGLVESVAEGAGQAVAEQAALDFRKGCSESRRACVDLRRGEDSIATGYVLDSSPSHIAIFDTRLAKARAFARDGIELVSTRDPRNALTQ